MPILMCCFKYNSVQRLGPFHSFILLSLLRQVYSLLQTEFSTECDLILPLSVSSTFSVRSSSRCPRLSVTSIILPCIFSLITNFRKQFLGKMWLIQLAFLFIVCRIFMSPVTLYNTSSFILYIQSNKTHNVVSMSKF